MVAKPRAKERLVTMTQTRSQNAPRRRRRIPFLAFLCALPAALTLQGCQQSGGPVDEGPDIAFLKPSKTDKKETPKLKGALLPLAIGNAWKMRVLDAKSVRPGSVVVSSPPGDIGANAKTLTTTWGKSVVRRDIYSLKPDGLALLGMGQEKPPFLTFTPPIPLVSLPVKEGEALRWTGVAHLGPKVTIPATAYHRISSLEPVTATAGKFTAYRIDSMITLDNNGKEIRYPMVMWLAPGVGIIARRFANNGGVVTEDLSRVVLR